jgi:hypothetical protein
VGGGAGTEVVKVTVSVKVWVSRSVKVSPAAVTTSAMVVDKYFVIVASMEVVSRETEISITVLDGEVMSSVSV